MKKLIALLLAAMFVMSAFAACTGSNEPAGTEGTTEGTTAPAVTETSTQVLENIWNAVAEDSKFFVMGGNVENVVDGKPGEYNMEYAENLTYNLLIPADQLANVTEVGFVQHGMIANNFTAGVVRVTSDVKAFADVMRDAIKGNMWMCDFPETLVIAQISDDQVLVSFGINDAMNPFVAGLNAAYANAEILYNEPVME